MDLDPVSGLGCQYLKSNDHLKVRNALNSLIIYKGKEMKVQKPFQKWLFKLAS
jgi:hypothetical protein